MSTSSTVSVPLFPAGESSQIAIVFTVVLPRLQALSPLFMNSNITGELVYKHTTVEPVVVKT